MHLVKKKLAKTFKPGMMFHNSTTPENQLCFMTDISVQSDCVPRPKLRCLIPGASQQKRV